MQERTQDIVQTLILCLVAFFGNIAITTASLGLVYYFRGVYLLSASGVGVATQISTGTFFFGCMCLSPVVQRLRPRVCVSVSLLCQGLLLAAFAYTPYPVLGYLELAVYGLLQSLLWPAVEAWMTRGKEGAALTRVTNGYNFSWSLGAGLASFLAGVLAEASAQAPFVLSVSTFLLLALCVCGSSLLVPLMRDMKSETMADRQKTKVDHSTPLRFPSWAGVVLVYLANNTFLNIFPLYAMEQLGYSKAVTGLLLLARGLSACFCFMLISHSSFWQFRFWFIALMQGLLAILCAVAGFIGSVPLFVLYFICFGVVYAFCYELSMFHGVSGSTHRAKRMAMHETLLTSGQIVGAVLGGILYQHVSFQAVMALYGCMTLVALAAEAIWWTARKKQRNAEARSCAC